MCHEIPLPVVLLVLFYAWACHKQQIVTCYALLNNILKEIDNNVFAIVLHIHVCNFHKTTMSLNKIIYIYKLGHCCLALNLLKK